MKIKEFNYGNYSYRYELLRQDRKTLSLTVRPDLGIVLKCPVHAEEDRINVFLKRKWMWLTRQLKFFEKFQRKAYEREYISGESFMYLGRQYKLIVKKGKDEGVTLTKGKLTVMSKEAVSNGRHNKQLINSWYQQRAEIIFRERFNEVLEKFNCKDRPELVLRKMNKRWGSFLKYKKIILNPQLIHTSKECIDYVIAHELCHMKYKKHDKRFFDLLQSKVHDWEKKKDQLESSLNFGNTIFN